MIKFYCFHCGTKISAELADAGASANCPTCSQDLVVPGQEALPEIELDQTRPPLSNRVQSADMNLRDAPEQDDIHEIDASGRSLGDSFKSVAKDGWLSIQSQSKQVALRAQIEKLRKVDLYVAHRAYGEKCFESGIFNDQLAEQFQAILDLDATIAGKREAEEVEEGETKVHALKRMAKHAANASHAQALLLKRQRLLAQLGRRALSYKAQLTLHQAEAEFQVVDSVVTQIRRKEEEVSGLSRQSKNGKRRGTSMLAAAILAVFVFGVVMWRLQENRDNRRDEASLARGTNSSLLGNKRLQIEREFQIELNQGVFMGYNAAYIAARDLNRHITDSDYESLVRETSQGQSALHQRVVRFMMLGMVDGDRGRPNRLDGIDFNTLPPAEPAQ